MNTASDSTWKPVEGHILTRWAAKVDPENVLPEYPRPQLTRPEWLNLNGLWEYAITPREIEAPENYEGEILVPFPVESALSGVKLPLLPDQRLWYRRTFAVPAGWADRRVLLHFGAVDWEATIHVNDKLVGTHTGGYDPFTFDITPYLRNGENELVVAVWDASDSGNQQRGKQVLEQSTIWYTPVSGIWQSVWLEPVPEAHIQQLKITPAVDSQQVEIVVTSSPTGEVSRIEVSVFDAGILAASGSGVPGGPVILPINGAKLWSPESPHLYDLEVRLVQDEKIVDQAGSYFGMRKFSMGKNKLGQPVLCLNDKPLFQYGPLDQGYWPDGLYTPPTDEALRFDIEYTKKLGCNMIRKHIKVEPARWYYHCDRLGMIVWQDMVSGGKPIGGFLSVVTMFLGLRFDDRKRLKKAGRFDPASRAAYRHELKAMIDHLHNFSCIAVWVPFNEAWGQFNAAEIADWVKTYDPTRLVDHASGWFDQGDGDFQSLHIYFRKLPRPKVDPQRAFIFSEFGGYSLILPGRVWDPKKKFGYRFYDDSHALTEAYLDLLENQLKPLIKDGLAAAVYTQTTDVEIEVNGYLTYDREISKMDDERLREAHTALYEAFNSLVE